MELDIVGLLETDLHVSGTSYTPGASSLTGTQRVVFGNRDLLVLLTFVGVIGAEWIPHVGLE